MTTPLLQDVPTNAPLKDNLLADAIGLILERSGYEPSRGVQIAVRDGGVLLIGCVPNYYRKQLAQSAAMKVPGIARLQNHLEVL
ncbi:MAG TPA: BON domain-containing protein [Planctomycetaceae bacterium]|nr:BON domain-containing protein [Planctomycetaceae bacterium]